MSQLTIENNVFFSQFNIYYIYYIVKSLWLEELILLFGENVKSNHILRFYHFAYTLVVSLHRGVFCIFEDNCDGKSLHYLIHIYGIFLVYEIFFTYLIISLKIQTLTSLTPLINFPILWVILHLQNESANTYLHLPTHRTFLQYASWNIPNESGKPITCKPELYSTSPFNVGTTI